MIEESSKHKLPPRGASLKYEDGMGQGGGEGRWVNIFTFSFIGIGFLMKKFSLTYDNLNNLVIGGWVVSRQLN